MIKNKMKYHWKPGPLPERKITKDTTSQVSTMWTNPTRDTEDSEPVDIENTHLDELFFDGDTYKIYKINNPKKELGYPTTEKGFLHIFNRYKSDRLSKFYGYGFKYNTTDESFRYFRNYDTMKPDSSSNSKASLVVESYPIEFPFLTYHSSVRYPMNFKDGDTIGKVVNSKNNLLYEIKYNLDWNSISLEDTDNVIQIYVTPTRTYTRNNQPIHKIRRYMSPGHNTKLDDKIPANVIMEINNKTGKYKVDSFFKEAFTTQGEADIFIEMDKNISKYHSNIPVFLDESGEYTIKKPLLTNEVQSLQDLKNNPALLANGSNLDIPEGLIWTELGWYRDKNTSDDDLRRNLNEFNTKYINAPTYTYDFQDDSFTGPDTFTSEGPIKNIDQYLALPIIPDYMAGYTSILEGEDLEEYLSKATDKEAKVSFLHNIKDIVTSTGISPIQKRSVLQNPIPVNFMESVKAGYPLSEDVKTASGMEKSPMEWTEWTSIYYPDSDRHNTNIDNPYLRHHISKEDIFNIFSNHIDLKSGDVQKWIDEIKDDVYHLSSTNVPSFTNPDIYLGNNHPTTNTSADFFFHDLRLNTLHKMTPFVISIDNYDVQDLSIPSQYPERDYIHDVFVSSIKPYSTHGNVLMEYVGDQGRVILESKEDPRIVKKNVAWGFTSGTNLVPITEQEINSTYDAGDPILYTDNMRWNKVADNPVAALPKNTLGLHADNLQYQQVQFPVDWCDGLLEVFFFDSTTSGFIACKQIFMARVENNSKESFPFQNGVIAVAYPDGRVALEYDVNQGSLGYLKSTSVTGINRNKSFYITKAWWR